MTFWGQISGADFGRLKSDAIIFFLYFSLSLQISIISVIQNNTCIFMFIHSIGFRMLFEEKIQNIVTPKLAL